MNSRLENLRGFLEDAHAHGTECVVAEKKLIEAKNLLHERMTREESETLKKIIMELEQVHQICSLPKIPDDDSLCGV